MASKPKKCKLSTSQTQVNPENKPNENEMTTAILELENCQNELDKITETENEEIIAIEQNYKKVRQHHFNQRNIHIDSIPDFWYSVFTSHPDLCNLLFEEEEDCFHYLRRVEVVPNEQVRTGYCIKLYFNENPYFKNELLVKEFIHERGGNTTSTSTNIEWKKPITALEGHNNTFNSSRKTPFDPPQSFFSWFSDNSEAGSDIVAEIIKDDIWLNPLQYYLVGDEENDEKDDESSDEDDPDEVEQITARTSTHDSLKEANDTQNTSQGPGESSTK